MEQIQVLLVDEEPLIGTLISTILNDEEDIHVTHIASSFDDAIENAADADVVIISTSVPDQGALELVRAINAKQIDCGVVVMGMGSSSQEILAFVEAGITAYVPKEGGVDDLLENIRAAAQGNAHASPEVVGLLMDRIAELTQLCDDAGIQVDGVPDLTDREQDVLKLVAEGMTNQEIADTLYIELGTVKNHVHNLLTKLNVSNRQEAARYFRLMYQ